jgi:hypothetical protein
VQDAAERLEQIAVDPAVAERLAAVHRPEVIDTAIAKAQRNARGNVPGCVVRLLNLPDFKPLTNDMAGSGLKTFDQIRRQRQDAAVAEGLAKLFEEA